MRKKTIKERLQEGSFNTVRVIGLGFLFVILIGAVLLWMPFSVTTPMKFTDALFTSVTAVCVTGLVTVTPAVQFTVVGKVILLFLIQIGGLGIIACVVAFMILAGQRISLRRRVMIQESYGLDTLSGMVQYIIRIIKGTFFVEGIGALAYSFYFVPKYGVLKGIAYAIFHAVSAFCNAGIDILGSSSYMHMVTSPIINFTTIFLVVSGGLGFVVWYDILNNIKQVRSIKDVRRNFFHRLSLQSKIVLTMTAGLLLFGMFAFLLLEYHNPVTMGKLTFWQKVQASLFQSVSTRTAGFATVSQSGLTAASKAIGCMLMMIGGSSGGTAGGVKTTTVALLLLTCLSVVRGSRDIECYGRKIPLSQVKSAVTILFLTIMFWLSGTIIITILDPQVNFLRIVYETTSAIATVGLSADLTPSLSRASQYVLMVIMYIGRIGPVTMAMIFAGKGKNEEQYRELPEKQIMIG